MLRLFPIEVLLAHTHLHTQHAESVKTSLHAGGFPSAVCRWETWVKATVKSNKLFWKTNNESEFHYCESPPTCFLSSSTQFCLRNFKRWKPDLSLCFPRWQQFPWSVTATTAVRSMSGRWRAVEVVPSSNSASFTAALNLPQTGVWEPVRSSHSPPVEWWHSTLAMDGPLFGYLVSAVRVHVWKNEDCETWCFL